MISSNIFDIIVAIILIFAFLKGYSKGAIGMAIQLAIVITTIFLGSEIATSISPHLSKNIDIDERWVSIISFILAFLVIAVILTQLGKLIQKIINVINLSLINRLIGGVLSISISMVIMSLALNIIVNFDKQNIITKGLKEDSFFYDRVISVVPAITPYLDFDNVNDFLNNEKEENKINTNIDV